MQVSKGGAQHTFLRMPATRDDNSVRSTAPSKLVPANLARTRPRQVAVLIETDHSSGCSIIQGVANYATKSCDWHLLIDPRDHEHRSALPEGWRGDGVVARITNRMQLEQIRQRSLPVVNVDDIFTSQAGCAAVLNDESRLAKIALDHLLDRGFREFGYFAPPSTSYSKSRGEAFAKAVEAAEYQCRVYRPGYRAGRRLGWLEQQRRVARWLASLPKPVAILTIDAYHARQLAEICHSIEARVPDDVAILAGDSNELMCQVTPPPISSILVASERIGFEAAQLLDGMMRGEPAPKTPLLIPPRGVTSRQSTDLLAIEDRAVVQALRFIRKSAHLGIVVEDILREVPISRRSLEIQFRNYLGRSPVGEIRRVQLERGRELLARQEYSITEVALACGFANATRFGVALKKETGKTPRAFRQELLSGKKRESLGI